MIAGGALCLAIRPNELVILAAAFALAMLVRSLRGRTSAFRRRRNALTMLAVFVFIAGVIAVSWIEAAHLLQKISTSQGLTNSLNTIATSNKGTGFGFGSSNVTYSSNPLWYPRDVYTVLFDPLPYSAHSVTQVFAALENTLILVVSVISLVPRLRYLPRVCAERPYVLMCLVYSAIFLYAFAALGNLGLITRERTLLLPFLFVVIAFPIARRGAELYPWQRRSRRPDPLGPLYLAPGEGSIEPAAVALGAHQWDVAERAQGDDPGWSVASWETDI